MSRAAATPLPHPSATGAAPGTRPLSGDHPPSGAGSAHGSRLVPSARTRTRSAPGAASTALRGLLEGPRRYGSVLAAFPSAVYVDMGEDAEPRVVALVDSDAVRLPIAVVLTATPPAMLASLQAGARASLGEGTLHVGDVRAHVARWWESAPQLGAVAPDVLLRRTAELRGVLNASPTRAGLAGHPIPNTLATACAEGDLASAVDTAEQLVGLGPGLTPSGDDILAGLLLSLRLLGGALPEGRYDPGAHPVMMADWLAAAVTRDAYTRTTAIAASLLHCASRGEAAAEVGAVLTALTGRDRLGPAMRRLLAVGHTSGADLGWGVLAGCIATLHLTPR